MKYSLNDWNKQAGNIPVIWNEKDYTDVEWTRHEQTGGFDTYQQNFDIYGPNIGVYVPQQVPAVFAQVTKYFDLQDLVFDLSRYTPGMLLPWHWDTYPTYSKNMKIEDKNKIVRIIVFLHPSQPGQQLWIEDKFCSGPAGSWFSWTGSTRHMAANLGETDRYVIQLTGHV